MEYATTTCKLRASGKVRCYSERPQLAYTLVNEKRVEELINDTVAVLAFVYIKISIFLYDTPLSKYPINASKRRFAPTGIVISTLDEG